MNKRLGLVEQQPIIQMSKNLIENRTLMAESFSVIKAQSVISLKYKLFNSSEINEVIISPYLLKIELYQSIRFQDIHILLHQKIYPKDLMIL